MAPLTFADTYNMVAFLSKSGASDGFDQIVVVTEAIIRRDLHLDDAEGVECLPNVEIFEELARMGYEKPPPKLTFYKAFFSAQWMFLIHTIVYCISAKRTAWNEFSSSIASDIICLATGRKFNFSKYIFDSMSVDCPSKFLMYPRFIQVLLDHQVDDMTTHNNRYKSPALTQKVFENIKRVGKGFSGVETHLFDSMLVQSQQQAEAGVELKKRINRLERKKKSKTSGLKRLRRVGADQRVESSSDTILETDKEEFALNAESQGRTNLKTKVQLVKENVNAGSKGVSDVIAPELVNTIEPTVFDDEDATMKMAQTLIKLKAEKARILDEKIAQKLHDEEQLDEREDDIDWSAIAEQVKDRQSDSIKRYQDLKKKPVSVTQAKKNMMIYLKNIDKEKRVADETLLQESFKKLRAAEVSGSESTQEIPTDDPKEITEEDVQNMFEIVSVPEFKVKAL
uniref:Synaptobrevin, longin-like domain protein n=1 Tax=Tanacetum cinerariifolium TaxID=118510 RepID=A0A699JN04_TANCI|nr:hypothetical protein [Tanacetum cinerariifolium]